MTPAMCSLFALVPEANQFTIVSHRDRLSALHGLICSIFIFSCNILGTQYPPSTALGLNGIGHGSPLSELTVRERAGNKQTNKSTR